MCETLAYNSRALDPLVCSSFIQDTQITSLSFSTCSLSPPLLLLSLLAKLPQLLNAAIANSDSEQQVEKSNNTCCVAYTDVSYTCVVYEDAGIIRLNFTQMQYTCGMYAFAGYMHLRVICRKIRYISLSLILLLTCFILQIKFDNILKYLNTCYRP